LAPLWTYPDFLKELSQLPLPRVILHKKTSFTRFMTSPTIWKSMPLEDEVSWTLSFSWLKCLPQTYKFRPYNITNTRGSISTTILLYFALIFGAKVLMIGRTFGLFTIAELVVALGFWYLQLFTEVPIIWHELQNGGLSSYTQHPHKNQSHSFKQGFFHASLDLNQHRLRLVKWLKVLFLFASSRAKGLPKVPATSNIILGCQYS
jgi:hypothetical protein